MLELNNSADLTIQIKDFEHSTAYCPRKAVTVKMLNMEDVEHFELPEIESLYLVGKCQK